MQEFNKTTTESYFIKKLLYDTYLPLLRTVREDDYIIKDRLYIYRCKVIKCTNSGYIPADNSNLDLSQAIKDDMAEYDILSEYYFGRKNGKLCTNFLSSAEGYDYKTHERLGKYLRCLRDMYGLNLMPLYNCFSNQPLSNIHILDNSVVKTTASYPTKVFKVPIRFNTTYTICMENAGLTSFAPAFIRHGTLLSLNNTKFGNGVDVTNKYIELNHYDAIHKIPNLRFKNPITIRFDNIPQTKYINYSRYADTQIASKYTQEYYKVDTSASHLYVKDYEADTYRTFDYDNLELTPNPVYQQGYEYKVYNGSGTGGILPSDSLNPSTTLIPTGAYDGYYKSINPSTGSWDNLEYSFKACPDDETFFNETIFNSNKTKYYTLTNNKFIQCTSSSIYNPSTTYYYMHYNNDEAWYEKVYNSTTQQYEFVKTSDTYINLNKTYYKKSQTEIPSTYSYSIYEENCTMYDYVEDELYLLIEVPSVLNSNIVVLEGDYTDDSKYKYFDDSKLEIFSPKRLDRLFTHNLKLMEMGTTNIIPFSNTLIQFLLWHVICNMDSLNNNMDRLAMDLEAANADVDYSLKNYWYNKYREIVFNYANEFPKQYITDNLGYVTTEIEKAIKAGSTYAEAKMALEITNAQTGLDEEEE